MSPLFGSTKTVVPKVGDIALLGLVEKFLGAVRKKRAVGSNRGVVVTSQC
jgi:hypothetical protein